MEKMYESFVASAESFPPMFCILTLVQFMEEVTEVKMKTMIY